jgi:D-alanyl-lipoteichoic acid acyltransferase DltB (MBOAT superfamily)
MVVICGTIVATIGKHGNNMLFNSYIFIFAFLPLVLLVYYWLNKVKHHRMATAWLTISSLIFYAYFNWAYCFILISSIGFNYLLHRCLHHMGERQGLSVVHYRKFLLVLGLVMNITLLGYFKYYNFFISNINQLFQTDFLLQSIVLPLGISFFTFQQISFIIDTYKGETPLYPFGDYALFVSFFPQLVAGPIVLHKEMIPQYQDITRRRLSSTSLYEGCQYFILGLGKKVIIADTFGRAVDFGYANVIELNSISAFIIILAFTFQIYFDFSGYCDMAIGLGKMFNFEIPINFYSPYKAKSVKEFWGSWHKTLTRFFHRYLYVPLGGNRKGRIFTCFNIMVVFVVSGLWHGAAWSFVCWGVVHGLALIAYNGFVTKWSRIPSWLRWFSTFVFINLTWVIFRADSMWQATFVIRRLATGGIEQPLHGITAVFGGRGLDIMLGQLGVDSGIYSTIALINTFIWIVVVLIIVMKGKNIFDIASMKRTDVPYLLMLTFVFLISIVTLTDVTEFLYFEF